MSLGAEPTALVERCVELKKEGVIAHVRLARASRHNAMDGRMIKELISCARQIKRDREIRAVILSGEGPSFCSGMDLMGAMRGGLLQKLWTFAPLWKPSINRYQQVCYIWRSLSVPVIAAVHGNCFGAGLQLALGADIRFARADARLSIMEANWGLVPDMSATVTLQQLLPMDKVLELTVTGRQLDGVQALDLGLVSHLADDPVAAARALCVEITNQSPDAVAAGKRLLVGAWGRSPAKAFSLERLWQRRMIGKRNQLISVERRVRGSDKPFAERTW